jgi:RNA polymerase sigma-70 factor, ECF subfamily
LGESTASFEEVALPHMNVVFRTALALCGNAHQAEDLVQTTFVKALERFDSFRLGTNCKAWLCQIVRNLWIDQLRHKKVVGQELPVEEELLEEPARTNETAWSNAQDLLENFSDEQVIKALNQLPEDQRLTLFLIDVEQFSQEEVAKITEVAVGTVKSRTSRARKELKENLSAYAQDMGLLRGE